MLGAYLQFHIMDATVMILMWNIGTTVLIVGLGALIGGRLFRWAMPRSPRPGD